MKTEFTAFVYDEENDHYELQAPTRSFFFTPDEADDLLFKIQHAVWRRQELKGMAP